MLPARWRIAASKPENRRPQQNPLKTQLRTWKLVEAVTVQGRSCAVVRLTGLGGDERVQDRMFSYVSFEQRVPANSNRFTGPLFDLPADCSPPPTGAFPQPRARLCVQGHFSTTCRRAVTPRMILREISSKR